MGAFDNIIDSLRGLFESDQGTSRFVQYKHSWRCQVPCPTCISNFDRIFERETKPKVPVHTNCDCYYKAIEVMQAGTVSVLGQNGPDWWLITYGRLPDYYITKEEAKEIYGWVKGRNNVSGKAPGKMIGGNVYDNKDKILPTKQNRIWYECDVDYFEGKRGSARLVYSNDGLIFYSPHHYSGTFYFVE